MLKAMIVGLAFTLLAGTAAYAKGKAPTKTNTSTKKTPPPAHHCMKAGKPIASAKTPAACKKARGSWVVVHHGAGHDASGHHDASGQHDASGHQNHGH